MKTSSATSLVTAAQMRAIEKAVIDSGAVTGGALMERAGRAVVDAIFAHWPKLAEVPGRAIVLCGPGNNGGDGYVIARLLQEWGWEVAVFAWGDPAHLSGDAAAQNARWAAMGTIQPLPVAALPDPRGGVIVDALFGTGLTRSLAPDLVQAMLTPLGSQAFDHWHRVAVDIPSGLCADSGRVLVDAAGEAAGFRADLTVTFHAQKPGHLLDRGPDFCGHVVVCDIGLDRQGRAGQGDVVLLGAPQAGEIAKQGGHKYDHGHALM
ncbi:MAG: NAD(P)H-hydrate epimerase, partial [Proteobacteria bacterium]|nr:NAD(P)H-hydrate epimerase [Pseudomonadota bacterium]